jgi:DNA (cytosine-5)-methyltransferase 1
MTAKPRLLDLFCGAGGAAMGYHRAGFDVVGVDINPQPRYPFEFHQADALEYLLLHGSEFDAVHASPPCQAHTTMSNRHRGNGGTADQHEDLIPATRSLLTTLGCRLWVMENVAGARSAMRSPLILHGGMFGLGVDRPRLFESNALMWAPSPAPRVADPLGVYGARCDGRRLWTRADGTQQRAAKSVAQAAAAMGIDWMNWRELCEAIPPAFTEWIGEQLLAHLAVAA